MTRYEDHERPTKPNNGKPPSDRDHTLGQLMVECLNHRHRIETLEARVAIVETAQKEPKTPSAMPPGNRSLLQLVKQTLVSTSLILAAIISTLKELGLLEPR